MAESLPVSETRENASRGRKRANGRSKFKLPVDLDIVFRPDDVLLATFPRSGTTWTVEIVRLLHLRHITRPDHPLALGERDRVHCFLEMMCPESGSELIEAMVSPRIFKTHAYYNECKFLSEEKNCKIILVYRDPKDVVCSLFDNANKKLDLQRGKDELQNVARQFFEGRNVSRSEGGPADWLDLNEGYMRNPFNYNILYIKYEDLKAKTGETISRINEFLGYPALSKKEQDELVDATSFDKMKLTHSQLEGSNVAKVGKHKGRLSKESITGLNQRIMELIGKVDDSHLNLSSYIYQ